MAISSSLLVLSFFLEQQVPQMVQALPELQGVHPGAARAVGPVQLVQAPAGDDEDGRPPAAPELQGRQLAPLAQEKGAAEDVRGL
jgi:hypothetical protein